MAQVMSIDPQRRAGEELLGAIGAFVGLSEFRASTRRVYQRTLDGPVDEFGGAADVAQITRAQLETHLRGRYGHTSPATYNRHLATISSLLSWCEDQEFIDRSPAAKIRRR